MSDLLEQNGRNGVICLFCGVETQLADPDGQHPSAQRNGVAIVRCTSCGKEAPYLESEMIAYHDVPNVGTLRVRAVGMS